MSPDCYAVFITRKLYYYVGKVHYTVTRLRKGGHTYRKLSKNALIPNHTVFAYCWFTIPYTYSEHIIMHLKRHSFLYLESGFGVINVVLMIFTDSP